MSLEATLRAELVEIGRRLYARGLISGHEGNLSVRLGEGLLVTPTGVCKGFLRPEDIVRTDFPRSTWSACWPSASLWSILPRHREAAWVKRWA